MQSLIEELGYRPNVLARQLAQQRTNILGVVVGDVVVGGVVDPLIADLATMVERFATARGYTAMFCIEDAGTNEIARVEMLLEYRVAGILFLASSRPARTMRQILEQHVPVVFVACHEDWGDVVSVDDVRGGKIATDHLIAAGHRRIAFLSPPERERHSDLARFQGYAEALREAGLGSPIRISWSPPAEHAVVNGRNQDLLDLFTGSDRVTAVFASGDFVAICLQEFADRVNLGVPDDLSIVGFGDVAMAGLKRIGMTTVAQPRDELARLAIATIADRIEQRFHGPPRTQLVGVSLVTRKSTAPPSTA